MSVETITLYRFSLPLIRPYKLALSDIEAFDTVLCAAQDEDGNQGYDADDAKKFAPALKSSDALSALATEAAVFSGGG